MALCPSANIQAQNLDNFDKENPVKLSGNISLGSAFYHANGIENKRSPFSYYLSANPTITLYGFNIPMSFTYRDQQGSLSNPFQRLSISPSWKWIRVHAGDVRMGLNPYIYSGVVLKGGGIELSPKLFRFSAAYGTLENPLAQIDTIVAGLEQLETYKRQAMTILAGVGSSSNYVELNFLRAKDDPLATTPGGFHEFVKAEENIALGAAFKFTLFKRFFVSANVASSAITADQNSPFEVIDANSSEALQRLDNLFTVNLSTRISFAGDADVGLKFRHFGISANYRRIDPQYKSLGTLYFQEDLENYTIRLNFSLWKNKIKFNGSGGIQRNNLNDLRSFTNERKIANGTLSLIPTKWFVLSARYSNFQTDRTPGFFNVSDTLRYAQTTDIKGGTMRFRFGKKIPSSITVSANVQSLVDVLSNIEGNRTIDNYIGNLSYNLNLKEKRINFTSGLQYIENQFPDRNNQRYGANIKVGTNFLDKKLKLNVGTAYHYNFEDFIADGNSFTGQIKLNYKRSKLITTGLNINFLHRIRAIESYQEWRATAKVSYRFNTNFKKETTTPNQNNTSN